MKMPPTLHRSTRRLLTLTTLAVLSLLFSCDQSQTGVRAGAELVRLGNGYLQIGFDANTGQLREFRDPATGQEFIAAGPDTGGITCETPSTYAVPGGTATSMR